MSNHVDEWLDGAERRVCSQPTPTGWDTGLCQDYCRKPSMWFASRLDARHTLRRWFGEQRKGTKGNEMTTHQDTSTSSWDRAISRKKSALELLGPLGFDDLDDGEEPGAIWHRECHITLNADRMSPAQVIAAVLEIGRERGRSEVQNVMRKALGL